MGGTGDTGGQTLNHSGRWGGQTPSRAPTRTSAGTSAQALGRLSHRPPGAPAQPKALGTPHSHPGLPFSPYSPAADPGGPPPHLHRPSRSWPPPSPEGPQHGTPVTGSAPPEREHSPQARHPRERPPPRCRLPVPAPHPTRPCASGPLRQLFSAPGSHRVTGDPLPSLCATDPALFFFPVWAPS